MKRVLVGAMNHESNSFNPIIAGREDFLVLQGQEVLARRKNNDTLTGILDTLEQAGYEPVPTVFASAVPNGLVDRQFCRNLRQQILEAADKGTTKVLSRILKVCIDNNLFRFSGAIRAFDMWTGMGYGDNKPAHVQKYAQLAYECLTDETKREEYYKSNNNVES